MGSGIAKITPRYSSDTYVPNWRNKFGSSLNNRHPLYLISVRKFLELYHNKEGAKMESHRILKRRGDLAELQHISKQSVIFGMCNFKVSLFFFRNALFSGTILENLTKHSFPRMACIQRTRSNGSTHKTFVYTSKSYNIWKSTCIISRSLEVQKTEGTKHQKQRGLAKIREGCIFMVRLHLYSEYWKFDDISVSRWRWDRGLSEDSLLCRALRYDDYFESSDMASWGQPVSKIETIQ